MGLSLWQPTAASTLFCPLSRDSRTGQRTDLLPGWGTLGPGQCPGVSLSSEMPGTCLAGSLPQDLPGIIVASPSACRTPDTSNSTPRSTATHGAEAGGTAPSSHPPTQAKLLQESAPRKRAHVSLPNGTPSAHRFRWGHGEPDQWPTGNSKKHLWAEGSSG